MWHVTSETRQVKGDRWQVTCDTWHMVWGKHYLKFQLSSSNGLGVMIFWRSGGKGSLSNFPWRWRIFKLVRRENLRCRYGLFAKLFKRLLIYLLRWMLGKMFCLSRRSGRFFSKFISCIVFFGCFFNCSFICQGFFLEEPVSFCFSYTLIGLLNL